MSSTETKVGSPPIVSARPSADNRVSTCSPSSWTRDHWAAEYGLVTRGSSWKRVTTLEKSRVTPLGSTSPLIGAALEGCGVADSGMCPSPANSAEVGSSPIQPAPGTNTSVQACRSVKSAAGPFGPSRLSWSEVSWTR